MIIRVSKRASISAAVEGKKVVLSKLKKLGDQHKSFLQTLKRLHQGELTLRIMNEALLNNFSELKILSVATLSKFLDKEMRISKRKANSRNPRVLAQERQIQLIQYAYKLGTIS